MDSAYTDFLWGTCGHAYLFVWSPRNKQGFQETASLTFGYYVKTSSLGVLTVAQWVENLTAAAQVAAVAQIQSQAWEISICLGCSHKKTKPNQTKPRQTKPNQTKPNQTKQKKQNHHLWKPLLLLVSAENIQTHQQNRRRNLCRLSSCKFTIRVVHL